jgi:hypothetical protein
MMPRKGWVLQQCRSSALRKEEGKKEGGRKEKKKKKKRKKKEEGREKEYPAAGMFIGLQC